MNSCSLMLMRSDHPHVIVFFRYTSASSVPIWRRSERKFGEGRSAERVRSAVLRVSAFGERV